MAHGVTPECRYGHGALIDKTKVGEPDHSGIFAAISVKVDGDVQNLDMGSGFSFEVWACPKCSYLEIHDYRKPKKPT